MTQSPPATVANPRLAALKSARVTVNSAAATTADELTAAVNAMNAKAWVSSVADAFYSALTSSVKDLTAAGSGCVTNIDHAIATCPSTIPNPASKAS